METGKLIFKNTINDIVKLFFWTKYPIWDKQFSRLPNFAFVIPGVMVRREKSKILC